MSTSVLDAIRTAWQADSDLTAIIPAARVFIGPPNPGATQPCIGFVSETHAGLIHTSHNRYLDITVTAVAEAEDAETLEILADVLREKLHTWTATRFQSIRLASVRADISREEDSPKELWVGRFTLGFDTLRLTTPTSTTTTTTTTAP